MILWLKNNCATKLSIIYQSHILWYFVVIHWHKINHTGIINHYMYSTTENSYKSIDSEFLVLFEVIMVKTILPADRKLKRTKEYCSHWEIWKMILKAVVRQRSVYSRAYHWLSTQSVPLEIQIFPGTSPESEVRI